MGQIPSQATLSPSYMAGGGAKVNLPSFGDLKTPNSGASQADSLENCMLLLCEMPSASLSWQAYSAERSKPFSSFSFAILNRAASRSSFRSEPASSGPNGWVEPIRTFVRSMPFAAEAIMPSRLMRERPCLSVAQHAAIAQPYMRLPRLPFGWLFNVAYPPDPGAAGCASKGIDRITAILRVAVAAAGSADMTIRRAEAPSPILGSGAVGQHMRGFDPIISK